MTTPLPVQSGVTLASCSDTCTELLHREPSAFSTVLMHPEYLLLGTSVVLPIEDCAFCGSVSYAQSQSKNIK